MTTERNPRWDATLEAIELHVTDPEINEVEDQAYGFILGVQAALLHPEWAQAYARRFPQSQWTAEAAEMVALMPQQAQS